MIDATSLRSQLSELLNSQIGSYAISAVTIPAIAVLPDPELGYNYPPPGTVVEGLEVVIHCPVNGYVPLMGNSCAAAATWEIRLKQQNANGSLNTVVNTLVPQLANLLNYARVGQPVWIPPNPSRGIVEQVLIQFTEYIVL